VFIEVSSFNLIKLTSTKKAECFSDLNRRIRDHAKWCNSWP